MEQGLELVMRAAAYAAEAHVGQRRKGVDTPYINHPLRVGHQAVRAGLPAEAVAAGLLHDVVEDTPVTAADLRQVFPSRVVELVQLLTQDWADDAPAAVKQEKRPGYYGAIARDPEAVALKLLDRADNLDDMVRMLPRARGWAERYLAKTQRHLAPLLEACGNLHARETFRRACEDLRLKLEETAR